MTDVFLPGAFAGTWYNNQRENQTIYIGNKRSVLVGMPRARQLRVKPSKFWYFLFSSFFPVFLINMANISLHGTPIAPLLAILQWAHL